METLTISVLNEILEPTGQDCSTTEQDLQLALTLNPDLRVIQQAMRAYGIRQIDLYKERVRDAGNESGFSDGFDGYSDPKSRDKDWDEFKKEL